VKLEAWAVGITAGTKGELLDRKDLWQDDNNNNNDKFNPVLFLCVLFNNALSS